MRTDPEVTRDEVFCTHKKYPLACAAAADIVMSSVRVSDRTLVQIVEEFEYEEEEVIRFACRDITSTTNIRELLSELNERYSHPVVLELLCLLKRFDLIKKHYRITKPEVERLLKKQSSFISDYRSFMVKLNEQIEEKDLDSIVFLIKNDVRNGGKLKNKTFLSLIVELEKNQLVTASNLKLLENLFQTIHRVDLKKRILEFQQKGNANSGGPYINAYAASPSVYSGSTCSPMNIQFAGSSKNGAAPVQETLLQIGDHDDRYPVRRETMGYCVIIDCVGNDAEMLQALFRSPLHFVVQCHFYKKVDEVEEILQDVANMEQHRNHDIFACVIISRGNSDSLFCLDGNLPGLSLDRIRNFFTGHSCPNLRGKPKLFFIQNYFVSNIEAHEGSTIEVDGLRDDASSRNLIQDHSKIPSEVDIFWSQCQVDELELQRSSGSTSLYLRSLRDLLSEKKNRKHRDLQDIHTELIRIIYAKKAGYSLQLRHTLTKKLFLYPA
ncbi:CASP8 and FADD-like apoptosis regulator isoform X3 [Bufo bufo]|uniref:CASP8 and FADD-like apoptosis regulator isoform X3 n=1 Tax=Bufo bufo TaxID=8384 RepID=UPI001ABEC1D4|nr:CASP8 and FADD-like apoptosis regulator isoform X3 [Bufo bufo]